MKTASVRDLRVTFPKVEKWLIAGETVQISKRSKIVGILTPPPDRKKIVMPDFTARMGKIFSDCSTNGDHLIDELINERGDR